MLRAVYEGVTYSIRDCLEGTHENGKIYLGGGGAKSEFWAQMIADCTGREVRTLKGTEYTAKGAAITAGVVVGIYFNIEEGVEKTISIKKKFLPQEENYKIYSEFYNLYKETRLAMTGLWELRKSIVDQNDFNN